MRASDSSRHAPVPVSRRRKWSHRRGSTGSSVEQVQFWLSTLAQYESSIPSVTVDGVYGSGTAAAVRAFQRRYGLTVDGIVGLTTWTELYDQFRSIQSDNGTPVSHS